MTPSEMKEARRKLGLSASQFATAFGIHTRTVFGWENERFAIPRVASLLVTLAVRHKNVRRDLGIAEPAEKPRDFA